MGTFSFRTGIHTAPGQNIPNHDYMLVWDQPVLGGAEQNVISPTAVWYDDTLVDPLSPFVTVHKDVTGQRGAGSYVPKDALVPVTPIERDQVRAGDVILSVPKDDQGLGHLTEVSRSGDLYEVVEVTGIGRDYLDLRVRRINIKSTDLPARMVVNQSAGVATFTTEEAEVYAYLFFPARAVFKVGTPEATVTTPQDYTSQVTESQAHLDDIALIGEILMDEANRRRWCSEYDEIVDVMNARLNVALPERDRTAVGHFSISGSTVLNIDQAGLNMEVTVNWYASYRHEIEHVNREANLDDLFSDVDVFAHEDDWVWDEYQSSIDESNVSVSDYYELRDAVMEEDLTDADVECVEQGFTSD